MNKGLDFSIGTDLVEVKRFAGFDFKSRLAKNTFTAKEIRDCYHKQNMAESLAARFAVKEAVIKCLNRKIRFNKIEVINDQEGRPIVNLLNNKLSKIYRLIASISHTKDLAQAFCLAYGKKE